MNKKVFTKSVNDCHHVMHIYGDNVAYLNADYTVNLWYGSQLQHHY